MQSRMRAGLALAVILGVGCGGPAAEPVLLECGAPACAVVHVDDPPRGRMLACEACAATEGEYLARAVELGCSLEQFPHEVCTADGGCGYAELVGAWERIRRADTCASLESVAFVDPCVRPDPTLYWTEGGGCAGESE